MLESGITEDDLHGCIFSVFKNVHQNMVLFLKRLFGAIRKQIQVQSKTGNTNFGLQLKMQPDHVIILILEYQNLFPRL